LAVKLRAAARSSFWKILNIDLVDKHTDIIQQLLHIHLNKAGVNSAVTSEAADNTY
jgi:hypothetical protein